MRAQVLLEYVTLRSSSCPWVLPPSWQSYPPPLHAVCGRLGDFSVRKWRAATSTHVSTSSSEPPGVDQAEAASPGVAESLPDAVSDEDKAHAGAALRTSFARLSPQGSDEWNFMGAFTHLGDRYGPYQPGGLRPGRPSALERQGRRQHTPGGRKGRLTRRASPAIPRATGSEVDDAMTHVVAAFSFLHAQGQHARSRLGARGRTARRRARGLPRHTRLGVGSSRWWHSSWRDTPGGEILHADCGEGRARPRTVRTGAPQLVGVEPRGGVTLPALERGCDVTISEVGEHLGAACPRAPSAAWSSAASSTACRSMRSFPLLADTRRALAPGRAHRHRVRAGRQPRRTQASP